MKAEKQERQFGFADKLGYMFGDFGNDFTFILSTMFLMKFYTDVMGVAGAAVGVMMMAARFADAFTDVTMGQIVDRSRPGKEGKFLPWVRRMSVPVALASFLMYASWFRNMPMGFKIFWMFFTYLLWGSVCYTGANIPYGSMASAVSGDPRERAQLSNWRTIGASLAGMVIGAVLPLVVYVKDAAGNSVLSGSRMAIAAAACSVAAVICYLLCCRLVTERVKVPQKTEKFDLKRLVAGLVKNRPLVGIIVSSVCVLAAQLSLQSMQTYIYPNYFGNIEAQSISSMAGSLAVFACAPFTVRLSEKFGRKKLGMMSGLFGAVVLMAAYFLHTENVWLFLLIYTLAFAGLGIFTLISWAMITDVIDDVEVQTGERSDGTIYAVYSFARKIGQAASSGLTGILLSVIGYSAETAFDAAVVNRIYDITCLVPAAGFLLLVVSMHFLYPLGKERVEQNARILEEKRNRQKSV